MKINNDYIFLYENLLKFRKEKGYSQEELGHEIGVSRQAVSKWESGESKPDMNNIIALCNCLEKDISQLVDGTEDILTKTNQKNNVNIKKIKKIVLICIILILIILLIFVMNRFIIIHNINNKLDKHAVLDNYHYNLKTYTVEDQITSPLRESEVYFKDGIYKETIKENGKEICVIWLDYNNKEGYSANLLDNTISEINLDNEVAFGKENGIEILQDGIVSCRNIGVELILSIAPLIKINSEESSHIFEYKTNGQQEELVKVWINNDNGLINKKVTSINGIDKFEMREYEIGNVTDEDVAVPDYTGYEIEYINTDINIEN